MARRLLIAGGEAASHPGQIPFGVRELIDAAEEILVVTPTLGRIHHRHHRGVGTSSAALVPLGQT